MNEEKYHNWIDEFVERTGNVKNKCLEATFEMKKEFPELIRKRGYVIGSISNRKRQHWWLETDTGIKIDPTESQFGTILKYIESKH